MGSLNADQFATLIADCEKIKADLDKLDQNESRLYAALCKRKPEDLLALMKVGGWLSAKEALDWGFVDEITDLEDEPAPRLTDALASAMASEGMPIPNIPLAKSERDGVFARFLNALTSLFNSKTHNPMPEPTPKTYAEEEYNTLNQQLTEANALANSQKKTIEERDATIADLNAKLAKKPAEQSKQVVDEKKPSDNADESDFDRFCTTVNAAQDLYNEVLPLTSSLITHNSDLTLIPQWQVNSNSPWKIISRRLSNTSPSCCIFLFSVSMIPCNT